MGADSLLIQQHHVVFVSLSKTTPTPNFIMFFLPVFLHQYSHRITLKNSKDGYIFVTVNKSLEKTKTNNALAPVSKLKYFTVLKT